jgi:DNA-binding transcriptional ArsR family regulator
VGIFFLTRDNLDARWLLYEAGAVAKTKDGRVCTFLIDVEPTDVEDPLGQFQHTRLDCVDVAKLVGDLNEDVRTEGGKALERSKVEAIAARNWPALEEKLQRLPALAGGSRPVRASSELAQETLETVRALRRDIAALDERVSGIELGAVSVAPRLRPEKVSQGFTLYAVESALQDLPEPSTVEEIAFRTGVGSAYVVRAITELRNSGIVKEITDGTGITRWALADSEWRR